MEWLQDYTTSFGGYAEVLNNGQCGICPYSSGDQYLQTLNMSTSVAHVSMRIASELTDMLPTPC